MGRYHPAFSGIAGGVLTPAVVTDPSFGDGVRDATEHFQECIDEAIAKQARLVIMRPDQFYILTDTLTIKDPASSQVFLDIEASGRFDSIRWRGAAGGVVFRSLGWKRSEVRGVKVRVDGVAGVTVWDIDGGPVGGTDYNSSSNVLFSNCDVSVGSGGSAVTGWRIGHSATLSTDFSYFSWVDCVVEGTAAASDVVGWRSESNNTLNLAWFGCAVHRGSVGWSNVAGAGAATSQGGDSLFIYGCGTGYLDTVFEFKTAGAYTVSGGRHEHGGRLLDVPNGGNSDSALAVHMSGLRVDQFDPADGVLVYLGSAVSLVLDGCSIRNATQYGADMVTASCAAGAAGSILLRGGVIRCADTFTTTSGGSWSVSVSGVTQLSAQDTSTGPITDR